MREYTLYSAIEKISVRTGMYTGDQTLSNIASYIYGYEQAMNDAGVEDATNPKFEYFRPWLKKKYDFSSDVPGWTNMILALAVGCDPKRSLPWERMASATEDEHIKSVKLFFSLVEEYKNSGSGN